MKGRLKKYRQPTEKKRSFKKKVNIISVKVDVDRNKKMKQRYALKENKQLWSKLWGNRERIFERLHNFKTEL